MKYRPEIDGLRALAVVPVILFHAGFELFSGGFVGVDVFFVISGYLITTILIDDLEKQRFSIVNFYERRARRILPTLFFVVLITYILSLSFLNPFDLKEVAQSIFATSIFSSNIYFYLKTGYFDTSAELKPLLHTWSLAVEEQYYLLFPIFMITAWRFGKQRLLYAITTLAIISFLLSEWVSQNNANANFYLPHTRAWELLVGSILAFMINKRGVQKSNILTLLGFSAILFSIFAYDKNTPFPSVYAIVPVLGTVMLILYANNQTFVAKVLSKKVFVGVGLISYSMYLWHQPLFALTRQYLVDDLSQTLTIILIFLTVFLSFLTWRYIEQPSRKSKNPTFNSVQVLLISALLLGSLACVGLVGHFKQGHPERNPNLLRLAQNGGLSKGCSGAELSDIRCKTVTNPEIALWGDSHAMHLALALKEAFPNKGLHQLTLSSCPPVPGYLDAPRKAAIACEDFNAKVYEYLVSKSSTQINTVILSSKFSVADPKLIEGFRSTVYGLRQKGVRVILVSSTPRFSDSEKCITKAMRGWQNIDSCSFPFSEAKNINDFYSLNNLVKSLDIDFVNLESFMCPEGICQMELDGYLVLRDAGHFTIEIQNKLTKYIKEKIKL